MANIRIVWTSDSHDCELCGTNYSDGAVVHMDDEVILNLEPVAHCYDGANWDREEVYRLIFEKLGHSLETDYSE